MTGRSGLAGGDVMHTSTADTLVPGCPATVHAAVLALASRVWAVGPDDVVTSDDGVLLVHGVRLDGQTDCWLTWTFTVAGPSLTRVRLTHDDAAVYAGAPEPDLDAVLGMLLAAVMADRTREGTS
jgi:hypothetical protein